MMVNGQGTRDLCGPSGLTTEAFVDMVAEQLATCVPNLAGPTTLTALLLSYFLEPPTAEPSGARLDSTRLDSTRLDSTRLFRPSAARVVRSQAQAKATDAAKPYIADDDVDYAALEALFSELDTDNNGFIDKEVGGHRSGASHARIPHPSAPAECYRAQH